MADIAINSDSATIPSVNFTEQVSDPATPAANHWQLFFKSGGLYAIDDQGTVVGPFGTGGGLQVAEVDGVPSLTPGVLQFPNGTLSDQGGGIARYTPAAAALLAVAEVDGVPSLSTATLQFPNGTLSDQGGNVTRYTPAGGSAPFVDRFILPWLWFTNQAGTWAYTSASSMYFGVKLANSSAGNNDVARFPCNLPAGTFTVKMIAQTSTDRGIMEVFLGATSGGTWDNYGSPLTNNVAHDFAGIVIGAPVTYLDVKVSGKNASSSGYNLGIGPILVTQTA